MEAPLATLTAKLTKANVPDSLGRKIGMPGYTHVDVFAHLADGTRTMIANFYAPQLREESGTNATRLGIYDEDGSYRGAIWVQNIEREN
jgi:hypothetical protein